MIKLTAHAKARMAQYGIDLAWVEATIASPAWTELDPQDAHVTRSFARIVLRGGRVLRVAHRPDGSDVLVLSVFFDRGARP
jgi:hypothetical protein